MYGVGSFPFAARPCGLPLAPSGPVMRNGRASLPPGHLWNVPEHYTETETGGVESQGCGGTRYRSASPAWILISRSLKKNLARKQTQQKQKRSLTDTRTIPAPDSASRVQSRAAGRAGTVATRPWVEPEEIDSAFERPLWLLAARAFRCLTMEGSFVGILRLSVAGDPARKAFYQTFIWFFSWLFK